jgi:DNA-binding NtrC family response regulator
MQHYFSLKEIGPDSVPGGNPEWNLRHLMRQAAPNRHRSAGTGFMATILLVEDDPLQAYLTMSLLGRHFGDVCRATDAAEALCLVEQPEFATKLSLVISGHDTPGISGPAFVAELHTRIPRLPVLVLGRADAVPDDYKDQPVAFLNRPFLPEKMLSMVREMLMHDWNKVA